MSITDLLETLMILCFGIAWPLSIYKSYTSRTSKGKSLQFEFFIWIGYIFGITRKFLQLQAAAGAALGFLFYLSWFFYALNFLEISIDMVLYFRNKKLDALRDAGQSC